MKAYWGKQRATAFGRFATRIAAVLLVVGFPPAAAQLLPQPPTPQQQNIPSGSPVLTQQSGQTSDTSERGFENSPPAVSGNRFEATEVDARERLDDADEAGGARQRANRTLLEPNQRLKPPAPPSEFEQFVERTTGKALPRFGQGLLLPSNRDYATPATATVPPGYLLNVGDTVSISMTGSIEGSVERQIDTDGRIFLPRVGTIQVAGVRFGDLKDTIARAIGTKFRNFTVTVSVPRLRGVRVYVTGFANNPGAYTVNSLSTLVNAVLAAGGPSSGGSFRSVKLYRNNELVSDFDLYRLILRGDRTGDVSLQNEDVLFIPPVGASAAVTGSVNNEAVFELRPGETLEQLLEFAGGASTLADPTRLLLYRLSNYDSVGAVPVARAEAATTPAADGDIVQLVAAGTLQRSVLKQSVMVRIEGEVNAPGNYYVPAGTPLDQVLERAGGLTSRAYVYGTRFERASARRAQSEAFEQALQQLQIAIEAAPISAGEFGRTGDAATQRAGALATLEQLRATKPDGRIVLGFEPTTATLPGDFVLENNDRIVVPPRPVTAGVYGAVYRPATFVLDAERKDRVGDYIERAGGALRAADKGQIFVVRANGDIVTRKRGAMRAHVLPGDVIFVPIKTQSSSVWAKIRDIATIAFQFGISAATVVALTR